MGEDKKKCKYKNIQTGWECLHEALEDSKDGLCIFHEKRQDKDIEKFNEGIKKILQDENLDAYHFEGFFFPDSVSFRGVEFKKSVFFCGARFLGKETHFTDAKFLGKETNFANVEFLGDNTDFSFTEFSGRYVHFDLTEFSAENTTFFCAVFSAERTYFTWSKFLGKEVDFLYSKYRGKILFSMTIFEAKTTFTGPFIDNFLLERLDLKNVDFRLLQWDWRSKLENERKIMGGKEEFYSKTSDIYQQLKVQFHNKRDFAKAGMFHFREQECKRKAYKPLSRNFLDWLFLWVSKLSCGYGEKLWIVFLSSVALVLAFAILYMFSGLYTADEGATLVFNYDLTFKNIVSISTIWKDFKTSFIFSVKGFFPLWRFQQYKVVGEFANLVAGIEFLLGAFMIGLFVYVFRRRMEK